MKNILNKLKKLTDKEFLKENINKVILGLLVIIVLVSTLVYFLITRSVSKIEYDMVVEQSSKYTNYFEDLDINSNELDKYIIYALDYSYYENSKSTLKSEEISDFLQANLSKEFSPKEIEDYGVNSNMNSRNITYDNTNKSYKINNSSSPNDIANTKVVYYKISSVRKSSKSKYKVTYTRYIIEDPYKALNYYIEKNAEDPNNLVDITLLKEYLETGYLKSAKEFFNNNPDDLGEYAKKDGSVKVEYEFVNNELRVIDLY